MTDPFAKFRPWIPEDTAPIERILLEIKGGGITSNEDLRKLTRRHPKPGGGIFSKRTLISTYRMLLANGKIEPDERVEKLLQRKRIRSLSGVAPVTVLTKPHPCPGKCIFCPTDVRMPKSYLPDEPGAQRAEQRDFDPYLQVADRIRAFDENGHGTDKIELLILGGTWSSYPEDYQEWFLLRCFDAMNGVDSETLEQAHQLNQTAKHRNVGLVIETRPDHVSPTEVRRLRRLGVTKVQLGGQSFDDKILDANRRGHGVQETYDAMSLLRAAGFKIVLHWMPNLLGATPESDLEDGLKLFQDPGLCPDEMKLYPCSLLKNAQLYKYWERGEWTAYEDDDLVALAIQIKTATPEYCRINRVFRDIPAPNIVTGWTKANLRQVVQEEMGKRGLRCRCIRCREAGNKALDGATLERRELEYETRHSKELFISMNFGEDALAGYLRLSLPSVALPDALALGLDELRGAALIREVHVYGAAQALGARANRTAQHRGVGTQLIAAAEDIAKDRGYARMAIIASVGTREYYKKRGYELEGTYMVRAL